MRQRLFASLLCLALLPAPFLAATDGGDPAAKSSAAPAAATNPPAAAPQDQTPSSVRPDSTSSTQNRSYAPEVHRRRSRISKGEVVFMGAIAGTSMGIGAIAGGGVGLAIGAIVGGWGAYAGHRLWHYFNK